MLKRVREIVEEECRKCTRYGHDVWKDHVVLVVKYAKVLAKKLSADLEMVELAALLHDIGSIKFSEANHEITGQQEAEKILKKLGYPQKSINVIKEAIGSHRGSKNVVPKSLTAKILATADAMAHFDTIPVLLRVGLQKENFNEERASRWVWEKLERDWTKKLTIPGTKRMVAEKYKAAKILLKLSS